MNKPIVLGIVRLQTHVKRNPDSHEDVNLCDKQTNNDRLYKRSVSEPCDNLSLGGNDAEKSKRITPKIDCVILSTCWVNFIIEITVLRELVTNKSHK